MEILTFDPLCLILPSIRYLALISEYKFSELVGASFSVTTVNFLDADVKLVLKSSVKPEARLIIVWSSEPGSRIKLRFFESHLQHYC